MKDRKSQSAKEDRNPYANVQGQYQLTDFDCAKLFNLYHTDSQNGSVIGITGEDFAVIAVDSNQEFVRSLHRVRCDLVLGSSGPQCNTSVLTSRLRARMFLNERMRKRVMPSKCVALLLSCLLTNERYFDRHVSILLAGLDHCGKGALYAYDPVGFHQQTGYRAMGCANTALQAFLNKELRGRYKENKCPSKCSGKNGKKDESGGKPTKQEAIDIAVCAFKCAARMKNVYTGNSIVINTITKNGICEDEIPLCKE